MIYKRGSVILTLGVVMMVLSSCYSTMRVRVDALNMPAFRATYLYNAEDIERKKNLALLVSSPGFTANIQQTTDALAGFIRTSGQVPNQDTSQFIQEIVSRKNAVIGNAVSNSSALINITSRYNARPNDSLLSLSYQQSAMTFQSTVNDLSMLSVYFRQIDDTNGWDFNPSLTSQVEGTIRVITEILSSYGESIISDPLSSIVAALPEQYWMKYDKDVNLSLNSGELNATTTGEIKKYATRYSQNRINFTKARTFFGNSDIAIKMTTPGEFIVKGVRVDADEAIRNSFKVVSQGIKYLAYASGVPVTESPNTPQKSITPLLDSLNRKELDYAAKKNMSSKATDALLQVIADASADLKATGKRGDVSADSIKAAALMRIKNAYAVYKASLN